MDEFEFDLTPEGCAEARQYLISKGKGWLVDDVLRTDGYTIVHMANQLKRELND